MFKIFKKHNIKILTFSFVAFLTFFGYTNYHKISSFEYKISPELAINTYSNLGLSKGKMVAASCAFSNAVPIPETGAGHNHEFADCPNAILNCPGYTLTVPGTSQCGGVCHPKPLTAVPGQTCRVLTSPGGEGGGISYLSCTQVCPSGYTGVNLETPTAVCNLNNPPTCPNLCAEGQTPIVSYINHNTIVGGIYYYPKVDARPTPQYNLPNCSTPLPANHLRRCEIVRTSSDGSQTGSWSEDYDTTHTVWSNQAVKVYPYTENIQVRCGIFNTTSGTYVTQSSFVQADAFVPHPEYGDPCSNSNACGVTVNGTKNEHGICSAVAPVVPSCTKLNICNEPYYGYECGGVCNAGDGQDINASCIKDFKVTSDKVNPNGSIEFAWKLPNSADSRCGFVDLTTETPRPIPGLQNLSASTDRVRINNIQSTTRFCLICTFFQPGSNFTSQLGEAVKHQWVKVIRIGED